jgi:RimJ/RimL family protein N-acetyltransferase
MKAPLLYAAATLETARLELEPLAVAHAASMFEGFADTRMYAWVDAAPPADVAELAERFARVMDPYARAGELWLNWTVTRRDDGSRVGVVEVTLRDDRVAHLASYVFPQHERQGFGREACAAVIDHLWRAYDAREIRIETDFRNVPARCLAESLGFARRRHVKHGTLRGLPAVSYGYRLRRPSP